MVENLQNSPPQEREEQVKRSQHKKIRLSISNPLFKGKKDRAKVDQVTAIQFVMAGWSEAEHARQLNRQPDLLF